MTKVTDEEYQELYDKGLTDEEMAELLPVHKSSVGRWRRKQGLPPHVHGEKPKPAPQKRAVSRKCMKCHYWKSVSAVDGKCCHYLLMEGHSRKCPIGDKCTKYRPKTKSDQ